MVIRMSEPLNDQAVINAVKEKISANFRLQKLQDYYEGKHVILQRHYDDPTKPNNRIVVNYCRRITDFMAAYLVGVPVTYEAPEIILDNLNYNDDAATMTQTTLNMNTHGFGCELFYTDADSIPRYESIDPRECIFIMDDTLEEILTGFIRVYPNPNNEDGYYVTVYTAESYAEYTLDMGKGEITAISEPTAHFFGDVPVVLYRNNREYIGTFEGIISLQDALNKLVSDELNDFESFVDAYLVLEGMQSTTSEDIAKMKQERVLLLDGDSKAYWLIKDVNNAHIMELKDALTRQIYELGNLPNLEDLSFGSSGVAIQFKLIQTEIQAARQERILTIGIQRKLELLYNIYSMTANIGQYTDVKITFERNFIMLANDVIGESRVDIELVRERILSRRRVLMERRGMTPDEADEELRRVDVEFHLDSYSWDMLGGDEKNE